jgi:hypothetical protein
MCHEVVEQPLDTCSRVSRHAQQGLVSRFVAPIGNVFMGWLSDVVPGSALSAT